MTTKNQYIQESAYYIWLNRGKPEGQDVEIWNEAVKIYELTHSIMPTLAKKSASAKKSVAKKAPAKKVVAKKLLQKNLHLLQRKLLQKNL